MRTPGFALGGGVSLLGPSRTGATLAAAGYTETDPGIKVSSGVGTQIVAGYGGTYINARLNNPATVSDLPSNSLRWTAPTKSLLGATRGSNQVDLIQAVWGLTSLADPPSADLILGWFITNGTVGFGGAIVATAAAGDWTEYVLSQAAGVWTRAAGGAAAATTVGGIAVCEPNNGVNQRLARCLALNAALVEVPAATGAAPAGVLTLADGLNTVGFYAGWATGVGGTANTDITIGGAELIGEPLLYWLRGF